LKYIQHIVCFSGGLGSAIVAIETVRRYGAENVILLNHNISSKVEDLDIKRFKKEVSEYLNISITYANMDRFEDKDQFDVSLEERAFTIGTYASCTKKLKTEPFEKYLQDKWMDKKDECIIYYGFDINEINRIVRRATFLGKSGFNTVFPLAQWSNLIKETKSIGIEHPLTYSSYKHANCKGCLKGGSQHWYVTYCNDNEIFQKAKKTEESLGYSIIKGKYLKDIECDFYRMKKLGIVPT